MKKMRVKIIYRNYIPLYSGYCSFWMSKIQNVDILIPKPRRNFSIFFKIYKSIKKFPFTENLVNIFQKFTFKSFQKFEKNIDLYFYTGLVPSDNFNKPFIIDFEHIYSLFNYKTPSKQDKQKLLKILHSRYCKKVLPWSIAAKNTLKNLYKEEYSSIENKVEVSYLALPNYSEIYKGKEDYSLVEKNNNIKLLFVGKDIQRKGLHEILPAFKKVYKKYQNIELYCITNYSEKFVEKNKHLNIHFFPFSFEHTDLIKKFFMTCDLFIMPTHADTFGMVYLEALSAGMPIIATKQFAIPEFLNHGENGYFVNSNNLFLNDSDITAEECNKKTANYKNAEKKLVKDIEKKLKYLISKPNTLKKLKKNCTKNFMYKGKFSFKTRNEQFLKIFKQAVDEK